MMVPLILALALPTATMDLTPVTGGLPGPGVEVTVDAGRRTVRIVAGPFTIAAMPAGGDHAGHGMHDMEGHTTPFLAFDWPVTGWVRGFEVSLRTGGGQTLDRRLIHHVNMMNFERRQLLYDAVERMLAAGQETENTILPRTIGLPMREGDAVGVYSAWANEGPSDIEDSYLEIVFHYAPTNQSPRPLDALPFYADVNYQGPGLTDSYDLPAGRSSKSHEFEMPIEGRLLAVGGHLHDYARFVQLEDLETGRVVVRLDAELEGDGRLRRVRNRVFAARGDGLPLHKGRRYRIIAEYDNPTGAVIPLGAMGIMAGLFAPAPGHEWPALDPQHPRIQADITAIRAIGGGAVGHVHQESPRR